MNGASLALIAAAAGVGLGHAILPDHWVPLAVVGRTQRYPLRRVARLSALAGVAHVLVSVLLGSIVIVVGLRFRSAVTGAQDAIVGALLIATGVVFATLQARDRGHHHGHGHAHAHDHPHPHPHGRGRASRLAAIAIPFGAAASPDLTILPVFIAATATGAVAAVGALVAFSAVTIGTIVGLTLLACFGGYGVRWRWLDRWGNALTAGALIVIGALVLSGAV